MLLCIVISVMSRGSAQLPEGQTEAQRRMSQTAPAPVAPAPQRPAQSPQGSPSPPPATTPGGPQ
jgi:hypothetical protein